MDTRKQINVIIVLIFASLIALGVYTIWDPLRAEEAEETQLEKSARLGAFVYAQYCRICHGDVGEGGALAGRVAEALPHDRPDLQGRMEIDGPVDPIDKEDAFNTVYNTIRCGRVGTYMPAWAEDQDGALNDEQILQLTTLIVEGRWDLAKHEAEIQDEESGPPVPPENPNVTDSKCGQVARGAVPGATPAGEPPPPSPGLDVFKGPVGCTSCHTLEGVSSGTVGPDLTHVATNAETRVQGMSAEDYIRQSIEDPTVFLTPEYPPSMSKLRPYMTDQEYQDLVEFLLSLE
jgi:mono/diheme cytochrome c family protein